MCGNGSRLGLPVLECGVRREVQHQAPHLISLYARTPVLQFERFLFTLETTTHHLPDSYTNALASLAQ